MSSYLHRNNSIESEMIVINCATNSTLQELKTNQSSGVFTYQNCNGIQSATSNRYVVWRTCDDILELQEHSLNKSLIDGTLKIQFKNTLILPNGVSIHEKFDKIYILVTTLVSAHRLIFDHPNKLISNSSSISSKASSLSSSGNSAHITHNELLVYSIFHNVSPNVFTSNRNYFQLPSYTAQGTMLGPPSSFPYLATCSWINSQQEATFVVSKNCGSLQVVKLPSLQAGGSESESEVKVYPIDLKQTSFIGMTMSLITGIVPSFKSNSNGSEAAINLLAHSLSDDDLVFALCRDSQIRVLSLKKQECLIVHNLLQNQQQLQSHSSSFSSKETPLSLSVANSAQTNRQPVSFKLWWHDDNTNLPLPNLVVYLEGPKYKSFNFYETLIAPYNSLPQPYQQLPQSPSMNSSFIANNTIARYQAEPHLRFLLEVVAPIEQDLLDYFVSDNQIWALMQHNDTINLQYYSIESTNFQNQMSQPPFEWIPVIADVNAIPEMGLRSPLCNLREYYLNEIFWKGHFTLDTIAKAITVSNRMVIDKERIDSSANKIDHLIQGAIKLVDNIIRNQIGENQSEITAEEYMKLELDAWHNLYLFCLGYHSEENKPMSIFVDYNTKVKGIVRHGKIDFIPSLQPFDELIDYYFLLCKESSASSNEFLTSGAPSNAYYDESPINLFSQAALEYRLNTLIAPIDSSINGVFSSTLEQSILELLYGMASINQTLSEEDMLNFEAFMNRISSFSSKSNLSLKDIAKKITEDSLMPDMKPLADSPEPFIDDFFSKCPMVAEAINFLLQCISFDFSSNPNDILEHFGVTDSTNPSNGEELHQKMQDAMQYEIHSSLSSLLSSRYGLEFIAKSIGRIVSMRYKFCRDLFLFQFMLTKFRFNLKPDYMPKIMSIEAETIPQTASTLFALYYLCWASQTPMVCSNIWSSTPFDQSSTTTLGRGLNSTNASNSPTGKNIFKTAPPNASSLENSELLSILEMREYINLNRVGILTHESTFYEAYPHSSILHFFVQFSGGLVAKRLLSYKLVSKFGNDLNDPLSSVWSIVIPNYFSSICQLLWPFSAGQFKVAEFLLGVAQYDLLERYIQRLHNWCMTFSYSRFFLKGICYLLTGEGQKAIWQFKHAVFGIDSDPFLNRIFAKKAKSTIGDTHTVAAQIVPGRPVEDLTMLPNARTLFRYYNKLIQLFKRYSSPDYVIEIVEVALNTLDQNMDPDYDEHHCSLQSTLFACHLRLGNVTQAYEAMINNSDSDQRRICLRQFILNLCENGLFASLVSFSYQGLEDDFVSILESKARASSARFYSGKQFHSLDTMSTTSRLSSTSSTATDANIHAPINYYHILYTYFIRINNYRRAAQSMYDYFRRLNQEANTIAACESIELLHKQANSLLIARNCLKLVDPNYSWIIKNAFKKTTDMSSSETNESNFKLKRKHASFSKDAPNFAHQGKTIIDIVDDNELLCEYELVNARLRLLQRNAKEYAIASTILTPEETVILCIGACLYEQALRVATLFKLSLEPIFDGMASKYVQLLHNAFNRRRIDDECLLNLFGNITENENDDGFRHNPLVQTDAIQTFPIDLLDIFYENGSNATSSAFISFSSLSICDRMWHLIMHYLARYEIVPQRSTNLMKQVAEKLLSNGIMLPASMLKIYQKVNCPEALRLLITYNFLPEATQLSLGYMNAFMGLGTEYFDLKHHFYPNCPPLCVPMHIFEYLLKALREEKEESDLHNLQNRFVAEDNLEISVDDYLDEEKINYEELYKDLSKRRQKLVEIIALCSR